MSNPNYRLDYADDRLCLFEANSKKPFFIDFLHGKNAYRRQQPGKRKQLLAKAIGIKPNYRPTIIDATAGLGEDSFAFACLGCDVVLVERAPIIASLLEDALQRLRIADALGQQMQLVKLPAADYFAMLTQHPDVIYLDPMYPDQAGSALNKKGMRILRELVGDDNDADLLLPLALNCAKRRVVVKRHCHAPILNQQKPNIVFTGKTVRLDVYLV